jgi:hypothetical protein
MSSSHLFFGLPSGFLNIGFHLYTFFLPSTTFHNFKGVFKIISCQNLEDAACQYRNIEMKYTSKIVKQLAHRAIVRNI